MSGKPGYDKSRVQQKAEAAAAEMRGGKKQYGEEFTEGTLRQQILAS
jgi:hypothetical protein